jgi:hypothetical protein
MWVLVWIAAIVALEFVVPWYLYYLTFNQEVTDWWMVDRLLAKYWKHIFLIPLIKNFRCFTSFIFHNQFYFGNISLESLSQYRIKRFRWLYSHIKGRQHHAEALL